MLLCVKFKAMFRHVLTLLFCVLISAITTAQTAVQHYNDGIKFQDQKKYAALKEETVNPFINGFY